jgi:hypothetical protein
MNPADSLGGPGDKNGGPEHLVPGDKNAPGDKGGEPDHLVPVDKAPPTDKDGAAPIDKNDKATPIDEDLEVWCPSGPKLAKKDLEARSGRNGVCYTDDPNDQQRYWAYQQGRGREYDAMLAQRTYSNPTPSYADRAANNYERQVLEEPEDTERFIQQSQYAQQYGFSPEPQHWSTTEYRGRRPNGERNEEAVMQTSYSRTTHNGQDRVAYLNHELYAANDPNRYVLDARGNPMVGPDGQYILAANYRDRSVPVSQLVHEGAMVSYAKTYYLGLGHD